MYSIVALQESDIADMYQAVQQSQSSLEELGWIAQANWNLFHRHYTAIIQQKKLHIFAIRVDGEFAGSVEIGDRTDHYVIGYWLGVQYRDQGIATEAVKFVLSKFDQKPIMADTLLANIPSRRLLEKLGFELERTNDTNKFYKFVHDKLTH